MFGFHGGGREDIDQWHDEEYDSRTMHGSCLDDMEFVARSE